MVGKVFGKLNCAEFDVVIGEKEKTTDAELEDGSGW